MPCCDSVCCGYCSSRGIRDQLHSRASFSLKSFQPSYKRLYRHHQWYSVQYGPLMLVLQSTIAARMFAHTGGHGWPATTTTSSGQLLQPNRIPRPSSTTTTSRGIGAPTLHTSSSSSGYFSYLKPPTQPKAFLTSSRHHNEADASDHVSVDVSAMGGQADTVAMLRGQIGGYMTAIAEDGDALVDVRVQVEALKARCARLEAERGGKDAVAEVAHAERRHCELLDERRKRGQAACDAAAGSNDDLRKEVDGLRRSRAALAASHQGVFEDLHRIQADTAATGDRVRRSKIAVREADAQAVGAALAGTAREKELEAQYAVWAGREMAAHKAQAGLALAATKAVEGHAATASVIGRATGLASPVRGRGGIMNISAASSPVSTAGRGLLGASRRGSLASSFSSSPSPSASAYRPLHVEPVMLPDRHLALIASRAPSLTRLSLPFGPRGTPLANLHLLLSHLQQQQQRREEEEGRDHCNGGTHTPCRGGRPASRGASSCGANSDGRRCLSAFGSRTPIAPAVGVTTGSNSMMTILPGELAATPSPSSPSPSGQYPVPYHAALQTAVRRALAVTGHSSLHSLCLAVKGIAAHKEALVGRCAQVDGEAREARAAWVGKLGKGNDIAGNALTGLSSQAQQRARAVITAAGAARSQAAALRRASDAAASVGQAYGEGVISLLTALGQRVDADVRFSRGTDVTAAADSEQHASNGVDDAFDRTEGIGTGDQPADGGDNNDQEEEEEEQAYDDESALAQSAFIPPSTMAATAGHPSLPVAGSAAAGNSALSALPCIPQPVAHTLHIPLRALPALQRRLESRLAAVLTSYLGLGLGVGHRKRQGHQQEQGPRWAEQVRHDGPAGFGMVTGGAGRDDASVPVSSSHRSSMSASTTASAGRARPPPMLATAAPTGPAQSISHNRQLSAYNTRSSTTSSSSVHPPLVHVLPARVDPRTGSLPDLSMPPPSPNDPGMAAAVIAAANSPRSYSDMMSMMMTRGGGGAVVAPPPPARTRRRGSTDTGIEAGSGSMQHAQGQKRLVQARSATSAEVSSSSSSHLNHDGILVDRHQTIATSAGAAPASARSPSPVISATHVAHDGAGSEGLLPRGGRLDAAHIHHYRAGEAKGPTTFHEKRKRQHMAVQL